MVKKAKKKTIATPSTTPADDIPATGPDQVFYGTDLAEWPSSWMGVEQDIPPGERLVACFTPFLEHLMSSDLSRKTIRKHIGNLWVLGGELVSDMNDTPKLRKLPGKELLLKVLNEDDGPLIYDGSEAEQRSFDSTCRKLFHFLTDPQR
jgi:hypothetical protein